MFILKYYNVSNLAPIILENNALTGGEFITLKMSRAMLQITKAHDFLF